MRFYRTLSLGLGLCLFAASAAIAATAQVLILHTNDLHDHLGSGYDGNGGLAYVAGYIESVRAERSDLLVLDAGDVTEKGDLVAFRTHGLLTYEAMRQIRYDAVTIGNHDNDAGVEWLHEYEKALGQEFICLNRVNPDGSPAFPGSRIVRIGDLRIGIIGMITPQESGCLDFDESGRALAREALRLKSECQLVIALCHQGTERCMRWSRMAPAVDLFVAGHSHEALADAVVVSETGARVVQAGCYARYVGRLEVKVDLDRRQIVEAKETLVPMRHDTVIADGAMQALFARREKELCPEARQVVFENHDEITPDEIAWVGAAALRQAAQADVGFCHGGQIIRDTLPLGPVDVNALFLTGGHRAHDIVRTKLTGEEITGYIVALHRTRSEPTNWSGFSLDMAGTGDKATFSTSLSDDKVYSVVMPRIEWDTRFMRMVNRVREKRLGGPLTKREFFCEPESVHFLPAILGYLEPVLKVGGTFKTVADQLKAIHNNTLTRLQ